MLLRLENVNLTHLVLASGKLVLQKKILGLVHAALVENLDFLSIFFNMAENVWPLVDNVLQRSS